MNRNDNDELEDDADPAARRVGYRQPPAEHRFKKGTSGNPRGRPPRKKVVLQTLVGAELDRKVPVVQNGERQLISCLEAIIKRSVQDALTGSPLERRLAIKFLTDHLPAGSKDSIPPSIRINFVRSDEDL